jgi:hypothetical protein
MPERLQHIPEAEDPGFFEMVEYFFHKSIVLIEDRHVIMIKIFLKKFGFCFLNSNSSRAILKSK